VQREQNGFPAPARWASWDRVLLLDVMREEDYIVEQWILLPVGAAESFTASSYIPFIVASFLFPETSRASLSLLYLNTARSQC
jgi:hypothetical protein